MFCSFYRIYKGVYSLQRIQGMNHAQDTKKDAPQCSSRDTLYNINYCSTQTERKKALNVKKSHDIIYSAIDILIEYKG